MADKLSIRVDSGIKRIEVNDAGEYISFSLNDAGFFDRFGALIKWLNEQNEKIQTLEDPDKAEDRTAAIVELAHARAELFKGFGEKIDDIFGPEATRKIFGGIIPDEVMIAEFFSQISPIIEKFAAERGSTIAAKYGRNRAERRAVKKVK